MTIHRTPHNITPLAPSNSSLWLNSCYAKISNTWLRTMKPSHPTPEKTGNKLARGNLDCTSLLEWFYLLCSLKKASVQLWYSPGKGLDGRAVAACPREALPEKAAISNISKQNNLKQNANRIICSGSFFHGAAHPRYSCFLIGMLITGVIIKSCWEMMRHHSKGCGENHNPVSKECSGKVSF